MKAGFVLFLIPAILSAATGAEGALWRVPLECASVQAGIDSASYGDTVLVACGTYAEHDIEMKPGVCLRSETGDASCVTIDAQKMGRVLLCEDLDGATRIEGITFRGGAVEGDAYPDDAGAGVLCLRSSPVIRNCAFTGNTATGGGGGVRMAASSPNFEDCIFSYNEAWNGGALYSSSSSPVLSGCTFEGNSATHWGGGVYAGASSAASLLDCGFAENSAGGGGGVYVQFSAIEMAGCVLAGNVASDGGGMLVRGADPVLSGCTFTGNSADYAGAIYSFDDSSPSLFGCTLFENSGILSAGGLICTYGGVPVLENTIIAFSPKGAAISCYQSAPTLTCCDLYGNQGGDWVGFVADQYGVKGNISLDPLFCDPAEGDLRIQDKSPCAPFSPPNEDCDLIGAWPVGCASTDISSPESTPASWSSVKSLFR